jgi:hypothetical protein
MNPAAGLLMRLAVARVDGRRTIRCQRQSFFVKLITLNRLLQGQGGTGSATRPFSRFCEVVHSKACVSGLKWWLSSAVHWPGNDFVPGFFFMRSSHTRADTDTPLAAPK